MYVRTLAFDKARIGLMYKLLAWAEFREVFEALRMIQFECIFVLPAPNPIAIELLLCAEFPAVLPIAIQSDPCDVCPD